jgi:hypothetical protein
MMLVFTTTRYFTILLLPFANHVPIKLVLWVLIMMLAMPLQPPFGTLLLLYASRVRQDLALMASTIMLVPLTITSFRILVALPAQAVQYAVVL